MKYSNAWEVCMGTQSDLRAFCFDKKPVIRQLPWWPSLDLIPIDSYGLFVTRFLGIITKKVRTINLPWNLQLKKVPICAVQAKKQK